jgi:Subtilase family
MRKVLKVMMALKNNKLHPELLLASSANFINYEISDESIDLIVEVGNPAEIELLREWIIRNGVFQSTAHFSAQSKFTTLKIKIGQLQDLVSQDFIAGIELASQLKMPSEFELVADLKTKQFAKPVSSKISPKLPQRSDQQKTLVACIDNGCPFAHEEFMTAAGMTRVVTIWDQDQLSPAFSSWSNVEPPIGLGYGLQVVQADLQKIIDASVSADGSVDEKLCYSSCSYEALRAELTHGSHVLGLLAGKSYGLNQVSDNASESDIAFVQLPKSFLAMPSGGAAHRYILDALRFFRDFANANQYSRCVVVCDYGSYLGPHDGSSIFERALLEFVEEEGVKCEIVFPSGNNAGQATHLTVNAGTVTEIQLDWLLAANAFGPSFAELWWHAADADTIGSITVSKPANGIALTLDTQGVISSFNQLMTLAWGETDNGQQYIALVAAPTQTNQSFLEPGRVNITIYFKNSLHASAEAYLSWGGKNLGQPAYLKQASWSIPLAFESAASVTDQGTLLGSACIVSDQIHIAGGYVGHASPEHYSRATYSSVGPTRGARRGPDCLACTDERSSLRGVPGPGTRSSIVRRLWGTSMAAPQLARHLINTTSRLDLPTRNEPTSEVGAGYLSY